MLCCHIHITTHIHIHMIHIHMIHIHMIHTHMIYICIHICNSSYHMVHFSSRKVTYMYIYICMVEADVRTIPRGTIYIYICICTYICMHIYRHIYDLWSTSAAVNISIDCLQIFPYGRCVSSSLVFFVFFSL
jgi:hypothetical protein